MRSPPYTSATLTVHANEHEKTTTTKITSRAVTFQPLPERSAGAYWFSHNVFRSSPAATLSKFIFRPSQFLFY